MAEETVTMALDPSPQTEAATAASPANELDSQAIAVQPQVEAVAVAAGSATLAATSAATPTESVPLQGEKTPEPSVGRIVHVVLDRGSNTGACRPAIVVRVWNVELINVQMFTDGLNDHMDYAGGIVWMTSLHYAKPVSGQPQPQTWHWSWED